MRSCINRLLYRPSFRNHHYNIYELIFMKSLVFASKVNTVFTRSNIPNNIFFMFYLYIKRNSHVYSVQENIFIDVIRHA
jgi:hypothetical protein